MLFDDIWRSQSLIYSVQNPKVKFALRLRERRFREQQRKFVIEGAREIGRALRAEFSVSLLFVCEELLSEQGRSVMQSVENSLVWPVSRDVFAKLAVRSGSDGVLAIAEIKDPVSVADLLNRFKGDQNFAFLALENVEKPGNLGAVLRTADGAGFDGVFLLGSSVDIYNPQVVRASVGSSFVIPVCHVSHQELQQFAEKYGMPVVSVSPEANKELWGLDLTHSHVLLFGSEAFGLSHESRSLCDDLVSIPMSGVADSLNLSVSVGVMAYESLRQRSKSR